MRSLIVLIAALVGALLSNKLPNPYRLEPFGQLNEAGDIAYRTGTIARSLAWLIVVVLAPWEMAALPPTTTPPCGRVLGAIACAMAGAAMPAKTSAGENSIVP